MTEPKFKRPVKTATDWPGKFVTKIPGSQYPWQFKCPGPFCFFVILAPDEETLDKRIEDHKCPWFGGGTTTFSWGIMSDDYIGPIWQMLDAKMAIVYDATVTDEARLAARENCRGLAGALSILMVPFFTTPGEIITEGKVRLEKKLAGEDYDTPGMGRLKWQRPPMDHDPNRPSWLTKKYEQEFDAERAALRKAETVQHSLSDDDVTKIKASKAFPITILTSVYGVSEAVIRHIWNT
jgi:hypothetical protein